ncbi:MAG: HD domain-containing protein [Verrucomicrobia bacterium]|nr:HD domain-containing protein [Verrucomicrobiota bacterium]NBS04825.1 HD domain-containing protein [Verrucomicrobiota bacterium]NBY36597.1 HD domain-containing protein [Verrucomicrobiota bacterium]
MPNLIPLVGDLAPVRRVVELLLAAGGKPYMVGGCVRDALLRAPVVDIDIEVYGLGSRQIEAALRKEFGIITVGAAFGVTKLKDFPVDVSVPRRENRTGVKHADFDVQADPTMTPKDAAERRDFTLNAILWDPISGEIVDPWQGQKDLDDRVLRHVSPKFSEDPLRVLRAMQFAARFEFTVAPETIALCRTLSQADLPPERLMEEWSKLILRGVKPSAGLNFLRDCGWSKFYPELHAMIDVPQDPEWHPEGCVWTHTALCLDAFAKERKGDRDEDLIVGLALLLHDIGKATTTKKEPHDNRWHAYGHEEESFNLAPGFLAQITREVKLIESILPLVRWHAQPWELFRAKAGDAAVRRLANKVVRIDRLVRLDEADRKGRGSKSTAEPSPQGIWLTERAAALHLEDSAPKRIVLGRHLIALGHKPAGWFSEVLEEAFEAQLDGAFADEAAGITWLKERMDRRAV